MDEKYSAQGIREDLHRLSRLAKAAIAVAIAVAVAAAPILSCSRRPTAESGSPPALEPARPAGKRESAATAKGPVAKASESPAAKIRAAAPVLTASLRAFGLGSPSLARMPEDYSLGPLQDYRAAGETEAGALAVAKRFMDGMASGRLDPALLVPDARDALALLLAPAPPVAAGNPAAEDAKAADLPYRLGSLTVGGAGDFAFLRVRLPASAGEERLEGSLALGKLDGAWYVESLSLDPAISGPLSFDPARSE